MPGSFSRAAAAAARRERPRRAWASRSTCRTTSRSPSSPTPPCAGSTSFIAATGLDLPTADLAATAGLNRAEIAREVAGSDEVSGVVEALEHQYDTFMEGREKPSLLATDVASCPSADEIGAEFEQFLRERDRRGLTPG